MIEVLYTFFCEDLRAESSAQTTAVGMWGGGMKVQAFPAFLKSLAFHVCVRNLEKQRCKFFIEFSGPLDQEFAVTHEGMLEPTPESEGQAINFVLAPVRITEPGEIIAMVRIDSVPPCAFTSRLRVGLKERPSMSALPASTKASS
jgi:hypothetical protein